MRIFSATTLEHKNPFLTVLVMTFRFQNTGLPYCTTIGRPTTFSDLVRTLSTEEEMNERTGYRQLWHPNRLFIPQIVNLSVDVL